MPENQENPEEKDRIAEVDKPEDQPEVVTAEVQEAMSLFFEHFAGPFPPPKILKEYKEIDESFAERVFALTENEAKHRHQLENRGLDASIISERRGSIFAFIISILGIGGSAFFGYLGYQGAAITLFITTIASMAGTFIVGRWGKEKSKKTERSKKALAVKDNES